MAKVRRVGRCYSWLQPERGRDGGDDLGDQAVQVGVSRPQDLQVVPEEQNLI